jgi:hypothetical protein
VFAHIENGSAELETQGQVSTRYAMKVLRSRNVEIKRTRDWDVGKPTPREARYDHARMSPQ